MLMTTAAVVALIERNKNKQYLSWYKITSRLNEPTVKENMKAGGNGKLRNEFIILLRGSLSWR